MALRLSSVMKVEDCQRIRKRRYGHMGSEVYPSTSTSLGLPVQGVAGLRLTRRPVLTHKGGNQPSPQGGHSLFCGDICALVVMLVLPPLDSALSTSTHTQDSNTQSHLPDHDVKSKVQNKQSPEMDAQGSDWRPMSWQGLVTRHPTTPRPRRVISRSNLS